MTKILTILIALTLLCSGCSLVPGYDRARESYEASQAQFTATAEALDKAANELVALKAAYDDAVAAGEMDKAAAILDTAQKAVLKYQTLKAAVDESRAAYEVAKAEMAKAETATDYVGTVIGLLLGAAGTIFGIGKARKATTLRDGLEAATGMVEDLKAGKSWGDVAKAKVPLLAASTRRAIDDARP